MKALFAVILSFASISAMACVSMGSNRVCPGDRAIVQNAVGKVIGVNPMQRKVSIDFTESGNFIPVIPPNTIRSNEENVLCSIWECFG